MHRLTEFSLRRPWLTLAILLAITAVLGVGLPKLETKYGYRVLVGDDHPSIQSLDRLIDTFGGGLPIVIAWECGPEKPCQGALDTSSLSMAADVTKALSLSTVVINVSGPASSPLLVPSEDGFSVRRLVENNAIPSDLADLANRAKNDRLWKNELVSADGSVGVILVQLRDTKSDTEVIAMEDIDEAIASHRDNGFEFFLAGEAPEHVIGGKALAESTAKTIPFTVLVIFIVIYFLSRSLGGSLVSIATMGVSLLWTFSLLGWLGWPQDGILEVLAPLLLIVGVCDTIHFLERISRFNPGHETSSQDQIVLRAAKEIAPACLITTLTTAAAFLSFTASALDTFFRFGIIAAFGIAACLFLTFSLMPALIALFPKYALPKDKIGTSWTPVINAIVATGSIRAGALLTVSAGTVAFFAFGWALHLRVDTNWLESWGDQSEVTQSIRFLENRLDQQKTFEVVIDLPDDQPIEEPETIELISRFQNSLSEIEGLGRTSSVIDLIEHTNSAMHGGEDEFQRVGATASENAEILEIITFETPTALSPWLSLDRSVLRVSVRGTLLPYKDLAPVVQSIESAIQQHLPTEWNTETSGELAIAFYHWLRDVQATQLRSFPIAFGIVFLLVSVFLRSWKLGLAAMVPTLLPVVVVLGAMGWLGMSLDVARAMLAAVVIGIGVDDAIHLLAHYKVRREAGDDPHAAISAALQHTGRAIVTTSVALALGFLTLMMSAWQTVASFGLFVAIAIVGALFATLFVLPALIFAFAPKETKASSSSLSSSSLSSSTPSGPSALAPALESKD